MVCMFAVLLFGYRHHFLLFSYVHPHDVSLLSFSTVIYDLTKKNNHMFVVKWLFLVGWSVHIIIDLVYVYFLTRFVPTSYTLHRIAPLFFFLSSSHFTTYHVSLSSIPIWF
jgi:hypothetical protein